MNYDQFLEKLKALDELEKHKNMRAFSEHLLRMQETDVYGWPHAVMKIKERIEKLNE